MARDSDRDAEAWAKSFLFRTGGCENLTPEEEIEIADEMRALMQRPPNLDDPGELEAMLDQIAPLPK